MDAGHARAVLGVGPTHHDLVFERFFMRHLIDDDTMFLANYSDGVTDLDLPSYVDWFSRSDAVAAFISVQPPKSYHVARTDADGVVTGMMPMDETDQWINAGYFVFRPSIFEYLRPGEDLVVEGFQRLIAERKLLAYRYTGFWAALDTFKEKVTLDEMAATGRAPWELWKSDRGHS